MDAFEWGSRWGRRAPVVMAVASTITAVAAVATLVFTLSLGPGSPVYPTCPPGPTPTVTCVFVPTASGPQTPNTTGPSKGP